LLPSLSSVGVWCESVAQPTEKIHENAYIERGSERERGKKEEEEKGREEQREYAHS